MRELDVARQFARKHEDAEGEGYACGNDVAVEAVTHRLIVQCSRGNEALLQGRYSRAEKLMLGLIISLLIRSTSSQPVVLFTSC